MPRRRSWMTQTEETHPAEQHSYFVPAIMGNTGAMAHYIYFTERYYCGRLHTAGKQRTMYAYMVDTDCKNHVCSHHVGKMENRNESLTQTSRPMNSHRDIEGGRFSRPPKGPSQHYTRPIDLQKVIENKSNKSVDLQRVTSLKSSCPIDHKRVIESKSFQNYFPVNEKILTEDSTYHSLYPLCKSKIPQRHNLITVKILCPITTETSHKIHEINSIHIPMANKSSIEEAKQKTVLTESHSKTELTESNKTQTVRVHKANKTL